MSRPLVIDEAVKAAIKSVVSYAEENRYDHTAMRQMMTDGSFRKPAGSVEGHICQIPVGYRCVYSIEQHLGGWMRHLSVSVDAPGTLPHPEAVNMLLLEFGFKQEGARAPLFGKNMRVWVESNVAINAVQLL